ncbi:MAG: hypothetical protein ISR77_27565 [Pirellulaceae bacterium]|nr:hypothetical protein [Pirellulaceae bacterium]
MTQSRTTSRWIALAVGLLLAGGGLVGLLSSVAHFDGFAHRIRTETRERAHYRPPTSGFFGGGRGRDSTGKGYVDIAGFEAGADALFFMLLLSLGAGISAGPFLEAGGRQRLSLTLGVAWHGLGIGTCVCYLLLAPSPYDPRPFLAIGVYEWLGLIPLALGVPIAWGRLRNSVWSMWIGVVPGVVVGGIVGVLFDYGALWVGGPPPMVDGRPPFFFKIGTYAGLACGIIAGIALSALSWRGDFGLGHQSGEAINADRGVGADGD